MCNPSKGYYSETPFRFLHCIFCDVPELHEQSLWPFSWITVVVDERGLNALAEGNDGAVYPVLPGIARSMMGDSHTYP